MEINKYKPIKITPNTKLVSAVFTEYRDYKFSNGFYFVGLDLDGNYINKEIIDNLNKLTNIQQQELLNSVFSYNEELYNDAIKIFQNTAIKEEYYNFIEKLEKFGIKDKIVSFMLPLGYSFNLDGSMMYMTFASIFIAQAYGVHLDLPTQLTMLFVLMLTSKGIAGVPRASLVVVAATCGMFKIPIEY